MRKNLFLTCALVLVSFLGVSAQQTWHRTLAGITGDQVTSKEVVDDEEQTISHYHVLTPVINLPEAVKGVRFTVLETKEYNQIKGGGPTFALGELIVRDADGKEIAYTAKTNCDHNTLAANKDGDGVPALNDGKYSTFFHSIWDDSKAPNEAHYIELNFNDGVTLDKVQLEWYTRPNQHNNRPVAAGLSGLGQRFTNDMLFSEYAFEVGEQVTKLADIEPGFYTIYSEDLSLESERFVWDNNGTEAEYTKNGDTYVSLSGYVAGKSPEATPSHIVQFIEAEVPGEYIIYQPLLGSFYGDAGFWTDGFNGQNGWQRASNDALRLQRIKLTERADGEFEMSYVLDSYYKNIDGENVKVEDDPVKVWVGYEMRGQLKLFPEGEKTRLEEALDTRNFSGGGFGLPVDFGFKLNKAVVADGVIPPLTVEDLAGKEATTHRRNLIARLDRLEEEIAKYEEYYNEWIAKAGQPNTMLPALQKQMEASQAMVENTAATADELKDSTDKLDAAANNFVRILLMLLSNAEVREYQKDEYYTSTFEEGKYPMSAKELLTQINDAATNMAGELNEGSLSFTQAYTQLETIWGMRDSFFAKKLGARETLPIVIKEENGALPGAATIGNNMIWDRFALVNEPVEGVRFTFLKNIPGNSNPNYNNYPMIVLGEIEIYDGEGNKLELKAENFKASAWEVNEHNGGSNPAGVEYLCDGSYTGAGTYYHSPWGAVNEGGDVSSYPWIEVTFPEAMSEFTVKMYSRDKTTTGNLVSLFPKEMAVTVAGEEYDPVVFSENTYNVQLGELVTSLSQITDDGIYAIQGLLNTHPVYAPEEAEDEVATAEVKAKGVPYWMTNTAIFHKTVLRADAAYRILKDGDDTYTVHSMATGKYWKAHGGINPDNGKPYDGYISSTVYKSDAAKLHIAAAEGDAQMANTWVLYEENSELKDTIYKKEGEATRTLDVETPHVVYMQWAAGVANRAVQNYKPGVGIDFDKFALDITNPELDASGDSLHFNKKNGEGQWKIYKITMDTPNSYWLANLYEAVKDAYSYRYGTDPGHIQEAEAAAYVKALADAQAWVEDSVSAADAKETTATAVVKALIDEKAKLELVETAPMAAGDYMIVSALAKFKEERNVERAVGITNSKLGWVNATDDNINDFTWSFVPSPHTGALDLTAEEAAMAYILKNKGTGYYVSTMAEMAESQELNVTESEALAETYLVQPVDGSSKFVLAPATKKAWGINAMGHGGGVNKEGKLCYWRDKTDIANQWFIIAPENYETSIDDFLAEVEGDVVVSVSYLTPAGVPVSAPVQGVNIVTVVYANGVVETKKVLVK